MAMGEFKEQGLFSSGLSGEHTVDEINSRIQELLEEDLTPFQIETIFEDLGEAVDNFKITGAGFIDSSLIFSLLERDLEFIQAGTIPTLPLHSKLHRIFYHISILTWNSYLSDVEPQFYASFEKLGTACTQARDSATYLLLLARLVDEGYVPVQGLPRTALLEKCLGHLCSDKSCDSVSIARALFALVLLESSNVKLSNGLKEKGLALVKKFEEMLSKDKNSEIPADQIQRVVQYLFWIHGKDAEGLLLKKFEALCRPIPNEAQIFIAKELKTYGYPLCVPEGRIGSEFCDLVVILPDKKKEKTEKSKKCKTELKKVVQELDGRLHYDEGGNLIKKDQKRDEKLRAKGAIVKRSKTLGEHGKKSKETLFKEVLNNLNSISVKENRKFEKSGTQDEPKKKLSNQFELLADKDTEEDQEKTEARITLEVDKNAQPSTDTEVLKIPVALDKKPNKKEDLKNLKLEKPVSRPTKKTKQKAKKEKKRSEVSLQSVCYVKKEEKLSVGIYVPSRFSHAWFKKLQELAAKKIPAAMNTLGFVYHHGYESTRFNIKQDYNKAFELFSEAAELGHPGSYCNLADYYLQGHVVTQNIDHGVQLLERAAVLGVTEARYMLAAIYTSPEYPYINAPNAMVYVNKAQAHIEIYYSRFLEDSDLRKASALKAEDIIRKIAILKEGLGKAGDNKDSLKDAISKVAIYSMELPQSENLSTPEKLKWGASSAQLSGSLTAVFPTKEEWEDLIQGKSVKGFNKAWFKELTSFAVSKKSVVAMRILGVLYDKGYKSKYLVIEKNYETAFRFFSDAAKYGDAIAMSNVGAYYVEGNYVKKDLKRGLAHLEESAKLGHIAARVKVAKVYLMPEYAKLGDLDYLEKAKTQADLAIKYFQSYPNADKLLVYQEAQAVLRVVAGKRLIENKSPPAIRTQTTSAQKEQDQPFLMSQVTPVPVTDNKRSGEQASSAVAREPSSPKNETKTSLPYTDFWRPPKTPELSAAGAQQTAAAQPQSQEHKETPQNLETESDEETRENDDDATIDGSETPEKPSCWQRTKCIIL